MHILPIELEDLELRQQEVGDIERVGHPIDPVAELEHVTHVEPVHDHVDRGLPVRGGEVHLPIAVEGVETLIAQESLFAEEGDHVTLLG